MNETEVKKERAVLAGLSAASMDERERSREVTMEELAALVETAGGEPVAFVMQNLSLTFLPNAHRHGKASFRLSLLNISIFCPD